MLSSRKKSGMLFKPLKRRRKKKSKRSNQKGNNEKSSQEHRKTRWVSLERSLFDGQEGNVMLCRRIAQDNYNMNHALFYVLLFGSPILTVRTYVGVFYFFMRSFS